MAASLREVAVRRRGAISAYFEALAEGDPVALGFTAVFALVAVGLGIFVWITKRRLDADDARWKKRRGY
jgi:hypothetical protein